MNQARKFEPTPEAYEDLLQRTLSRISCDLGRLIYIASTRDYNTGNYHHDGLAMRFRPEEARKALEVAPQEIFYRVSARSLEELVEELEIYICSSRESLADVVRIWERLEPYRIAIPLRVHPTVAQLFLCNVKLALAVLRFRQMPQEHHPQVS
jgi:hypothetical protein